MPQVIVISEDPHVCPVLEVYLKKVEGHAVVTAKDDTGALDDLGAPEVSRGGRQPVVVILHFANDPHPASNGIALLHQAAEDMSGRFARYHFILLMQDPHFFLQARRALLARLKVQAFALPFDLEEVAGAVRNAGHGRVA